MNSNNNDAILDTSNDLDDSFSLFELQPVDTLVSSFNKSFNYKFPNHQREFLLKSLVDLEYYEAKTSLIQSNNSVHFFSLFNDILELIIHVESICLTILQLDSTPSLQIELFEKYHEFIQLTLESFHKNFK